jgi:hypothetical protein
MPVNPKGMPPLAQRLRRAPVGRFGAGKGPASGPKPRSVLRNPAMQTAILKTAELSQAGNPVLRREADALLRVVLECRSRIGTDFYRMGNALIGLLDKKLYVSLGHATFAAMLEERRLVSLSVANRLIAVCRNVPRETALQLGPERSFEWLQLLRVQAGPDAADEDVQELAGAAPEVKGKPVAEMSTREIADLRRRMLERRAAGRADPAGPEAHRVARALGQRLEHAGAADARVVARYARSGWRIRIDLAVPAAQIVLQELKS